MRCTHTHAMHNCSGMRNRVSACESCSAGYPLIYLSMHLVECLDHVDEDYDAHDKLDDTGEEEEHTRLCVCGVCGGE